MDATTTESGLLVSADSHVIEPTSIWDGLLPRSFWGDIAAGFSDRPGGSDPNARLDEMAVDGVSAEVLYPSLALRLFSLEPPALQAECLQTYNDWLADYVSVSPQRLVGIGQVCTYDIDLAVKEVERCRGRGFGGIQIWQSPHPRLPFSGDHYEPLWEACAALSLPVSLHILTGYDASQEMFRQSIDVRDMQVREILKMSVSQKLLSATESLIDLLFTGVLDRHPALQLVVVENEVAWLPFFVDQCDYYINRFRQPGGGAPPRKVSEYLGEQVFATFFRDPNARWAIESLGSDPFMWSNDYPHANSTWPHSREVIAGQLGTLDQQRFDSVTFGNVCNLYGLPVNELEGIKA